MSTLTYSHSFLVLVGVLSLFAGCNATPDPIPVRNLSTCKVTPSDSTWPMEAEWAALNTTLGGSLIKTIPFAFPCYTGLSSNSTSCQYVQDNWGLAAVQASLPEGIDYPIYGNNSCIPPGATGYSSGKGCVIGASPRYVVSATSEEQIATAMSWGAQRNLRIVVKGTGHDMNGRSTGAYSLSIWTHNFQKTEFNPSWPIPGSNETAQVAIVGSGNNWRRVYTAAHIAGRVIVGGDAQTVGLGGYIQGGGHGPLSSQHGLAADQIYQATVVTTEGEVLVANNVENPDLLWAIRGGGPGTYGVVTEYVLKTYPEPSVITNGLSISTSGSDNASITATWDTFAAVMSILPDLMDAGLAGAGVANVDNADGPVSFSFGFYGYDKTAADMDALVKPLVANLSTKAANTMLSANYSTLVTYSTYFEFFEANNIAADTAGEASLMSSRLLGRKELSETVQADVASYLKRLLQSKSKGANLAVIGMQGGPGPANVPEEMRGALNPVWRTTYLHAITFGSGLDPTADPKTTLTEAGDWMDQNNEAVWREWAPDTGAYINEANPFNTEWKHDYFGATYDRLLQIKARYDPTNSLFIQAGVGSDSWSYDLSNGMLCAV